ncbi:hypothetical protein GbCGDNIH3_7194 [Granulibacter bethesdensis]|uniref:Uncharacterized protein n=1 Tax=Granulibacter bethesdensis TaxID=364410 RepID=A0AAN0RC20_9PROT|nr:hypothetical protein GbCGDNIH3_7194 [Granulibacter bethesdensis]
MAENQDLTHFMPEDVSLSSATLSYDRLAYSRLDLTAPCPYSLLTQEYPA